MDQLLKQVSVLHHTDPPDARVQFRSRPDPGASPGAAAPQPPFSAVCPTRPCQILVLDDDKAIAELLAEMLGLLGYSTILCHSVMDALGLLEQGEFDLIISDFRMPKMNGEEFYRLAVQKRPALAQRIIFLTGDMANDETQGFLESTGNPHLSKPFQLARVEETVAAVLKRNGSESRRPDAPDPV